MKRVMAHIGFSMAITLFVLNLLGYKVALISFCVIAICLIISILCKKTRQAVAVPLCLGSALLACFLFVAVVNGVYLPQQQLDKQTKSTIFQIVDLPEKTKSGYSYTIKTIKIDADNSPQNIKLNLYTKNKIDAQPYDYVKGNIKYFTLGNSSIDSYGKFSENIFLYGTSYGTFLTETNSHKNINYYLLKLREHIKYVITSALRDDYAGVVLALLIGDKSQISNGTLTNFKTIGVTHLMAISGLHTSLWATIAYFILKKLKIPETPRALIVIAILICYCSLAGFSKSVIRSTIMVSIMLLGRVINKHSDALNSLGLAVSIICLNPFSAVDVSAVLSVLATLSLLTLRPKLYWYLYEKLKIHSRAKVAIMKVANTLIISLCVLIYTFPAAYIFFGYISVLGLISNIIFIPIGTITMVLSSLLVIISKIGFIGYGVAYLTGLSAKIMILLSNAIAKAPIGIINVNSFVVPFIIGSVLILFAVAIKMNNNRALKVASICCVVVVLVSSTIQYYSSKNYAYLKIYQSSAGVTALLEYQNNIAIFGAGNQEAYYKEKNLLYSNGGKCSLLLVPTYTKNDSRCAKNLSYQTIIENFVVPYDNGTLVQNVSANNVFVSNDFNVNLWGLFNVKYKYDNGEYSVLLTIYEKSVLIYSGVDIKAGNVDLLVLPNNKHINCNSAKTVVFSNKDISTNSTVASTYDGDITFVFDNKKEILARRDVNWGALASLN